MTVAVPDPDGWTISPPPGHRLAWLDEVTRTAWRTTFIATGAPAARRGTSSESSYVMGCDCGRTFTASTVIGCTDQVVMHFGEVEEGDDGE